MKRKRLFIVFAVILCFFCYGAVRMLWEDHEDCSFLNEEEKKYYYANNTVSVDSEKWLSLSALEQKQQFEVDDEKIDHASTNELMKIVMAYPYMADIYLFDSVEAAHNRFKSDFNAYRELIRRKDFEKVLNKWKESAVNWGDEYVVQKKIIKMLDTCKNKAE